MSCAFVPRQQWQRRISPSALAVGPLAVPAVLVDGRHHHGLGLVRFRTIRPAVESDEQGGGDKAADSDRW